MNKELHHYIIKVPHKVEIFVVLAPAVKSPVHQNSSLKVSSARYLTIPIPDFPLMPNVTSITTQFPKKKNKHNHPPRLSLLMHHFHLLSNATTQNYEEVVATDY